ncbi:MAG: type II toxin-antitoxin system death-on-curing family toxin [Psittacicella sp.]
MIGIIPKEVVKINSEILQYSPGLKGSCDIGKLEGALSRVDNEILYTGLNDIILIATKIIINIAQAHAFSDANKRTGLMVGSLYLESNNIFLGNYEYISIGDALCDVVSHKENENYLYNLIQKIAVSK